MTAPGIMRKFKMTHIAAVDSPAQKGARVAIIKRDEKMDFDDSLYESICKRTFTADERKKAEESGHAMPGGRYPINNTQDLHNAIRAVGRGKGSHAAIRSHIMQRARALGATDAIPENWKASKADLSRVRLGLRAAEFSEETVQKFAERIIEDVNDDPENALLFDDLAKSADNDESNDFYQTFLKSVESILGDPEADKASLLQETAIQFKDALASVVSDQIDTVIGKALASNRSTDTMTLKAIAKSLGLAEDASEDAVTKALGTLTKRAEDAEKIAKMSSKHKLFMEKDGKMPSGGKDAYMNMSPAERDAHIAKNPISDGADDEPDADEDDVKKMIAKGDAFRDSSGNVFTKKDFGTERAFTLAKSQAATIAKQQDDIAKSENARLQAEFAKRAEPLTYIGKADEVGGLLFDIAKLDGKLAERVEEAFKVMNERLAKSALFQEQGSGRGAGEFSKAGSRIDALAKELISKEPDLFKNVRLDKMAAARAEIRKRNPDLAQMEQDETKSRKAA